jgi:hypothetical protein
VALSLVAAACSGSASGQVGSTLAAMDGTVTLVKVISPATITAGFSAQPAPGHKLVAVVLTIHSPATATAKFGAIYIDTKLVDSTNQAHLGKATAKYAVTSCAGYLPFSTLGPGLSQTGCEIFQLAGSANPVTLKISGKASADWTIAASAVQPPAAAIGSAPTPTVAPAVTPTSPPATEALGTTPSTTAVAPNTSGQGATGVVPDAGGKGTTGASPTGGTGTGATTPATTPAPKAHKGHVAGTGKAPRILRVTPRGGYVGSTAQIYGKRLSGVTQVTFNGVPAAIVKSLPGRIVVVVPPGATTGSVVVYTTTGTLTSPRTYVVL